MRKILLTTTLLLSIGLFTAFSLNNANDKKCDKKNCKKENCDKKSHCKKADAKTCKYSSEAKKSCHATKSSDKKKSHHATKSTDKNS